MVKLRDAVFGTDAEYNRWVENHSDWLRKTPVVKQASAVATKIPIPHPHAVDRYLFFPVEKSIRTITHTEFPKKKKR